MSDKTVMSEKRYTSRGSRLLLSLFVALGVAASVSVATQHTALAASCAPTKDGNGAWHIASGCTNVRIPAAHHCMVVGTSNDGKTQGVECADIYVTNTDDAHQIWGEGEYSCSGAHPKCLGMNVMVWVSAHINAGDASTASGAYKCATGCPNGSQADVSTSHLDANYACVPVHSFEPADGATVTTGILKSYTNHEVISINGASEASHARSENNSNNLTVCIDGP